MNKVNMTWNTIIYIIFDKENLVPAATELNTLVYKQKLKLCSEISSYSCCRAQYIIVFTEIRVEQ